MANSAPSFLSSVRSTGFSRQTRTLLGVLALGFSCVAVQAVRPALRTYSTLVLNDGRQLVDVGIIGYTANGVLVRHSGGATVLRTKLLPADVISDLRLSRLE